MAHIHRKNEGKTPEGGHVDTGDADVPDDVIHVDLTEDEESMAWLADMDTETLYSELDQAEIERLYMEALGSSKDRRDDQTR